MKISIAVMAVSVLVSSFAFAQDKIASVADDLQFEIEFDAAIKARGGSFEAHVNLPLLPAGKLGKILLTLHNPTSTDITFGDIRTSCGCITVTSTESTLRAQGELPLAIQIRTPSSPKERLTYIQFTMYFAEGRGITVYMKLDLSGIVAFKHSYFSSEVERGESQHTFRMPVIITPPVDPEALEYLVGDGLGELDCKFVSLDDGSQFIECKTTLEKTDDRNRAGVLTMLDPVSNAQAATSCIIKPVNDMVVAPIVLRFARSEDGSQPQSRMTTKAIVRLHDSTLFFPPGSKEASEQLKVAAIEKLPEFSIGASHGEFSVSARRLAKGIYRVELVSDDDANRESSEAVSLPESLTLKVDTGNVQLQKELKVVFWGNGSK